MLLFEKYVTVLLPVHAILATLTVALSTHLAIWLRHYCRGQFSKQKATRRFALLSAGAYSLTMLLGMALYPTYKVRVRAEYLENPSRIHRATELEVESRRLTLKQDREIRQFRSAESVAARDPIAPIEMSPEDVAILAEKRVERAAKIIRWFDVKEHWAFLGLLLSLTVCGILYMWKPNKSSKSIAQSVRALAATAAAIAWASAIIGLVTAAARSVAAL